MMLRPFHRYAGLGAAIVPFAIVVHLIAEAAATKPEGIGAAFIARHAYFGVLFIASAAWFSLTAGLGRPAAERRRLCALLRADLAAGRLSHGLLLLVGANLAFFALTQAVEGFPVVAGGVWAGLAIALSGSLLSALAVFVFGARVAAAGLESVIGESPLRSARPAFLQRTRRITVPRHPTSAYSLFIPNRPPPAVRRGI